MLAETGRAAAAAAEGGDCATGRTDATRGCELRAVPTMASRHSQVLAIWAGGVAGAVDWRQERGEETGQREGARETGGWLAGALPLEANSAEGCRTKRFLVPPAATGTARRIMGPTRRHIHSIPVPSPAPRPAHAATALSANYADAPQYE